MKKFIILFVFPFILAAQVRVEKLWETEEVFKVPESVFFNEETNEIYVANINGSPAEKDGNGFISKLSRDGKVIELKWITGLDAPKGMCLSDGRLYVTDISRVAEIDIKKGEVKQYIEMGGEFLNDISSDEKGAIYISDNAQGRIYRLKGESWEVWLEKGLPSPNGMLAEKERLLAACMGNGEILSINYESKKTEKMITVGRYLDGLVYAGEGSYIVSDFTGKVWHINKSGAPELIIDYTGEEKNSADIGFILSEQILLVPTFHDNRVIAYSVKEK